MISGGGGWAAVRVGERFAGDLQLLLLAGGLSQGSRHRPAPSCGNQNLSPVSWPWVPAWGSLEPSRRGGENAQKTRKNGEKMGEIRPKKCEGRELTKDQLGPSAGRRCSTSRARGPRTPAPRSGAGAACPSPPTSRRCSRPGRGPRSPCCAPHRHAHPPATEIPSTDGVLWPWVRRLMDWVEGVCFQAVQDVRSCPFFLHSCVCSDCDVARGGQPVESSKVVRVPGPEEREAMAEVRTAQLARLSAMACPVVPLGRESLVDSSSCLLCCAAGWGTKA